MVFLLHDIKNLYGNAKDKYKELGVNTDLALNELKNISLSIHCWQGDDVGGFERPNTIITGGGILATGNYPGKARTINELQMDLSKTISLIPGNHRVNLHASYGEFKNKFIDRNAVKPEHFQIWIDWAKEKNIGLDFNSTLFSHPKSDAGFTLSSKTSEIRHFWIEHVQKCREISAEIGRQLNNPVIHNLWIPDGFKDIPVDRSGYRELLKNSLDQIFTKSYNPKYMKDSLEGKLFGIGSEAFVVGSHDFYLSYALKNNLMLTLDMGHFHPTESVADKISAILPFLNGIMIHISRGVRWDSDHVVILNDDLIHLSEEIIRCKNRERIYIGLDFFDASINRIGAWVIGARSTLKSLLYALLQPLELLKEYEENNKLFQRLAILEEVKSLPFGAVWDYYCYKCNVPIGKAWIKSVEEYEHSVLVNRT
ncbi:MAG: L-rhamnose isomerase [Candidatus Lokiarchaeota archaeon]|nr:L-rhamnose isomerase [Candidatus Lokiarchaeota archaeon]